MSFVESDMSNQTLTDDASMREQLSALADGELEGDSVSRACAAWRDDASVRAYWHACHLVGDVLRSEDLASSPGRDAAFLASLRERLAQEPVVLAPEAPKTEHHIEVSQAAGGSRGRRRWSWIAPSAVAAGFVAVAGVLIVSRAPTLDPVMAQTPSDSPSTQLVESSRSGASLEEPQTLVVNGAVIRDAQLDRYLAAHKQFATTSVLGAPSGFLRNAAVEVPKR
jgi:sigma-E factor negative regulatory protein RseA